jgi:hypothetical protein
MKKFNRIFLCVVSLSILLLGSYAMVEEFGYFGNFFEDLEKDSFLLIPIYFTFFSIFCFLFNIKKFNQDISIASTTYKIFRIGDLVFAISLFILIVVGLYFYIGAVSANKLRLKLLPLTIMIFFLFFAILDIADNILYHKKQVVFSKKESIEDIKGM